MSLSGLCRLEDVTLLSRPAHSYCLQSQSSTISYDKTIITKLQIGKMGYFALAIRDTIHVTKAVKGQAVANFLADHSVSISSKLYDDLPDEVAEVCTTYAPSEE